MRNPLTVVNRALMCLVLLLPACGGSNNKTDGAVGLKQDTGSGGRSGSGGVPGTGGGPVATGGVPSSGGAIGAGGRATSDAGPARDGEVDGPAVALDANLDQRPEGDTRDVPLEPDAVVDGAAAPLDSGNLDGAATKPEVGPDATPEACAAAGGFCSRNRWTLCPAHYEPAADKAGHLDCPSSGWCCVPAPASPCSDQGTGNCVVGTTCSGCWSSAHGTPACESGRVCCIDICD